MKVLYVVQNYYPSIGGTQILFQNIAEKCLTYYNDEGVVYTTNSYFGPDKKEFKKIDKKKEVINGISVHRFPFLTFYYWLFGKTSMLFKLAHITMPQIIQRYRSGPWSPSLKKAMNQTDADVIFASSSNYLYMLYPLKRDRLSNPKPFVFQGAVHFTEDTNYDVLFSKTLHAIKASEYYMANTSYEKDRLIQLGVDADSIVVTGVAVDMEMYTTGNRAYYRDIFGVTEDNILIGYIGRLEATKGVDILIKAFKVAKESNKNLHLVIAGFRSSYARKLENYVESIGGKEKINIHFVSNLSMEQKVNLYHSIDIFVLPSANESFGIVFLEAWSCKKPVIGTDIGAIRSVISNGVDGLLMKPHDDSDLAEKILLLSSDQKMREEFGCNGFKKTAANYTWPIITKKYREVFLMAINKFNVQRRSNLD